MRTVCALLALAMLAGACTGDTTIGSAPIDQTAPDELEAAEDGGQSSSTIGAPADWTTCRREAVDGSANVVASELLETSGLAASGQHDGVLWAHNDSGSEAGVFAMGLDGSDRGFFRLDGVSGVDIEDMALVDGRIYLADFGDNAKRRSTVEIYIFDEPVPAAAGGGTAAGPPVETVIDVTTISLLYPDGSTDAEGLLVDPETDEMLILSKDLDDGDAPTRIYSVPSPNELIATAESNGASSQAPVPAELTLAGTLDVAALDSQATEFSLNAVLFPGLVTAADISADGRLIALRTYGTVWLFRRSPGRSMIEALTGDPCESGTAAESQGEAVAFLPQDGSANVRYVTIGEGTNPAVNVVTVELR